MKTIRRVTALLLVALLVMPLLGPWQTAASADGLIEKALVKRYKVTASSLRLRAAPSTSSEALTSLPKGAIVTLLATGNPFYKVRTTGNTVGYAHSDYLAYYDSIETGPTPKPTTATGTQMYKVTTSSLYLRSEPNTSSTRLETLRSGMLVELVSKYSSAWFRVRAASGKLGYVSAQYIKYSHTIAGATPRPATPKPTSATGTQMYKVTASSLYLRSEPSTSSTRLETLKSGALVELVSKYSSAWFRVRAASGKLGYVSAQYIKYSHTVANQTPRPGTPKPTATPTPTPKPTPTPTDQQGLGPGKIYSVNASTLNLRKGAGTTYGVLVQLKRDELVTYVSAYDSRWWKVRTRKNVAGYVDKTYLVYEYTIANTPTPTPTKTPTPTSVVDTSKQKYTYAEMLTDIRLLCERYPTRTRKQVIGESLWGDDIVAVMVGNPNAPKSILVDGTLHAREYMCSMLIMSQMEYYLQHPNEVYNGERISDILDDVNIWFVPMMNPDGVYLSQNGIAQITNLATKYNLLEVNKGSKVFTRWKANGRGVDLNRNFDSGWGIKDGIKTYASEGYAGKSAESETESKALVAFARSRNFRMALNYHTQGNMIYWNYFQTGAQYDRDKALVQSMSNLTGYRIMPDATSTKSGGFMDYFIKEYKRPSMTVELGSGELAPQSISKWPGIWKANKYGAILMAQKMK